MWETFLRQLGFKQFRVRYHGEIARMELDTEGLRNLLEHPSLRMEITKRLKEFGFTYVTLDLEGYRTGSMNEPLLKSIY